MSAQEFWKKLSLGVRSPCCDRFRFFLSLILPELKLELSYLKQNFIRNSITQTYIGRRDPILCNFAIVDQVFFGTRKFPFSRLIIPKFKHKILTAIEVRWSTRADVGQPNRGHLRPRRLMLMIWGSKVRLIRGRRGCCASGGMQTGSGWGRLHPVRDHLTGRLRKPGLDMLNKNNQACHWIPFWLPVPKELLQFLEASRLISIKIWNVVFVEKLWVATVHKLPMYPFPFDLSKMSVSFGSVAVLPRSFWYFDTESHGRKHWSFYRCATQCYKSTILIRNLVLTFYYWKQLNFA